MVLTAYIALSPVIGFLVTVALRKLALSTRLGESTSARLDAGIEASGPHDFAVRFSAVRLRAWKSLTGNPPCDSIARQRCRVHRIPPQRS
jgi:hypothetical protein